MFTLKIQNNRGELYELTHDPERYKVMKITGLTLPPCNVNTSTAGTQDGEEYNSSHLEKRNLVITLALEGDIEASRQRLYRIFPLHSPVKVFFKNQNRDVTIDGYVETIDGDLFATREMMQISLICPQPYFEDLTGIYCEMGHELIGFSFPFGIPAEGMVIAGIYQNPVQQVWNNGTTDVGFIADVSVDSLDEPSLTVSSTESRSAPYLASHYALLEGDDVFDALDLTAQTLNVYVNGVLKIPETDYERDLIIRQSGHKNLWMNFPDGGLTNAAVTTETITVQGKSITDMRYWVSEEFTLATYEHIEVIVRGVPAWFDLDTDCIVVAYTSEGDVGRVIPANITAEHMLDGTYTLTLTFEFAHYEGTKKAECRIFGSVSKVDVHDDTITRTTSLGTWNLGSYRNWILSPTLPVYTAKDIFRMYIGTELTDDSDYDFETVTKVSDSSETLLLQLKGDKRITSAVTFEVISSIAGDDIHDYTQAQIDDGMCLVDNLTLTNLTTDEYMAFPDVQFRNGDKFTISTVQGNLYVTVTASGWMPVGKSLLYEVLRNGQFFKLVPGENRLGFTADSNVEYVSCNLRAKKLYGGV